MLYKSTVTVTTTMKLKLLYVCGRVALSFIFTDPSYFIPAFVALTSSNMDENRQLIVDHGITYPLGLFQYVEFTIYSTHYSLVQFSFLSTWHLFGI